MSATNGVAKLLQVVGEGVMVQAFYKLNALKIELNFGALFTKLTYAFYWFNYWHTSCK